MPKIEIRYQRVGDAKRFFEIVTNPNFIYLDIKAKSLDDEIKWLKANPERRKNNKEWNYSILCGGKVVGAIGMRINQARKHIGEIGYFIDEKYWGQGIATRAVKLIEKEGFERLGLSRIEILMRPENKASEKVTKKNGYIKEGRLRKYIKDKKGVLRDFWMYSKIK
ncbi:MAG: GNAT family N-acetyltransferase [Patescibacteria group bacterium]|jgi:ribosomal-protein-alanine N-acetyltransferase